METKGTWIMIPSQLVIWFDAHKFAMVKEYYVKFLDRYGVEGYTYLKHLYDSFEAGRNEWLRNGTARDRHDFELSQKALYDALKEYQLM